MCVCVCMYPGVYCEFMTMDVAQTPSSASGGLEDGNVALTVYTNCRPAEPRSGRRDYSMLSETV